MEIDNNRVVSLATPSSGREVPVDNQRNSQHQTSPETTGNSNASNTDKISFTGEASKLQALERELANQPVVDSQRVSTVRSAINNGTFDINPGQIAEQMISLEQALTDAR